MKRSIAIGAMAAIFLLSTGCGGGPVPEKLEISLKPTKGFEGAAGTAVIYTKKGTDITINITGLQPKAVYTAFFVNVKSKMFEGIGPAPHVLLVNKRGEVTFRGTMKKDVYKKFVKMAIYLNPGGKPIQNPLGVSAKLGALMKTEKPKMVLEGKLRE